MRSVGLLACTLLFAFAGTAWAEPVPVHFPSADGVEISGDLYLAHAQPRTPFIVLFHQAGWSRGEYREIAPKLNDLGYNCVAIDLRSGGEVNGVANQTFAHAKAKKTKTRYVDALPDMIAALQWAKKHHAMGPVIAWGSSYSAALVLRLAGEQPKLADGVLAFAPGEYFRKQGKSGKWVTEGARKITAPVFITSARKEKKSWVSIFKAIPAKAKASYLPKTKGQHGSRALWRKFSDNGGYWKAVKRFLATNFPTP